jgi:hypothetical protein
MALEFDAEFEFDDITKGGSVKAPPGWYHVQLENAEEKMEENAIDLRFVVLSPGEHCGKKIYERLWISGEAEKAAAARKKIHRYAISMRLFTQEEYDAARAAGTRITVDFPAAIGAQAVVELKEGKERTNRNGEKVKYIDIHWRIYDLAAKEAENCEMDREFASQWGVVADNPFASGEGGKSPAAAQAKSPTQVTPKAASFADI